MSGEINFKELAEFLVKAKISTYASVNRMKLEAERPGFDELEFQEGDYYYRDSYAGFFQAPGMEVVRVGGKDGEPIWAMAYSGGMLEKYHGGIEFAKQTFNFLKECLKRISAEIPFRGPESYKEGDFEYVNQVEGDVRRFIGFEKILYKGEEVFSQDYCGGIVLDK
jgi:hypothetical protein